MSERQSITSTISVNIHEDFDVDVTLRFSEIKLFFENCTNEQKLELRAALKLTDYATYGKTIVDTMKIELAKEAIERYSLEELESRLK